MFVNMAEKRESVYGHSFLFVTVGVEQNEKSVRTRTRRGQTEDDLVIVEDPEALVRKSRAEKAAQAQLLLQQHKEDRGEDENAKETGKGTRGGGRRRIS